MSQGNVYKIKKKIIKTKFFELQIVATKTAGRIK